MRLRRKAIKAIAVGATAAILATVGSAAAATPHHRTGPDSSHFGRDSNRIDNPWLPMRPGSSWVYDGVKDGKQARDVSWVTRRTKLIDGIRAAAVADRLYLNGGLAERTTDWYAQDRSGTVWYLGEATAELDASGKVTSREGSFQSGRDGARGGIFMPAQPSVGQSFKQEDYKGHAEDRFQVLDLNASITTPAIASQAAMLTQETTPLEPGIVDHKYYVMGVGEVKEEAVAGVPANQAERLELVSFLAG